MTPRKIGFGQVKQYEVDQDSDANLIKRVAQGESDAATLLIERYQGPLRSFLIKLTRRPHLADDLAQDTFIRMLRYADRYDPQYALKTWLFTIARRLFINHMRRAEQRNVSSEYLGMASEGPTAEELTTRADELNYKKQRIRRRHWTLLLRRNARVLCCFTSRRCRFKRFQRLWICRLELLRVICIAGGR